jgi:hypothetical protein
VATIQGKQSKPSVSFRCLGKKQDQRQ